MSKKLREYLRDQIAVFDIDGVLSVYEFGELSHTADVWEEAFVSEHDNPYCGIAPLPALQEFVAGMPSEHVYVCSVADDYEAQAKRDFVARNYPSIPADHVFLVATKPGKLEVLASLAAQHPAMRVAIVDDTVKTLDAIHAQDPSLLTVHVTSFFD